jgi:hypothetical protein
MEDGESLFKEPLLWIVVSFLSGALGSIFPELHM